VFDMGTGIRYFGAGQPHDGSFRGTCLLTHLHFDHTQGMPFFTPMLMPGAELDVYAPAQDDGRSVHEVFHAMIHPPLFPISLAQFPGEFRFHDVTDQTFQVGEATVMSRVIPHVGTTLGFRIDWHGRSVAYLSDHQQPFDGTMRASDNALELADGVDLLIHDAQYTPDEFAKKYNWGHCTTEYAVWFAAAAGAKRLALFHHDPTRHDRAVDELARQAADDGRALGVDVFAAREAQTVDL
jgi:phosphoribosyl 1,2-cyclic phosphodiesterase